MANFKMTDWHIVDNLPYITLGFSGENNASTIVITVDTLIENARYYFDIVDENGNGLPNTQELTVQTLIGANDIEINTLSMKPKVSWLGKEGIKLLQVRCVYEDNNEQIVKESNVIHAIVNGSVLNDYRNHNNVELLSINGGINIISLFEQYFQKIKTLIDNISIHGGGEVTPTPTIDHVYIDMKDIDNNGELTIEVNKYYHIIDSRQSNNGVVKLNIILESTTEDGDYHFNFISGNPATQLILPNDVLIPSNLSVSANSYYDMTINPYNHVMVCTSQGIH